MFNELVRSLLFVRSIIFMNWRIRDHKIPTVIGPWTGVSLAGRQEKIPTVIGFPTKLNKWSHMPPYMSSWYMSLSVNLTWLHYLSQTEMASTNIARILSTNTTSLQVLLFLLCSPLSALVWFNPSTLWELQPSSFDSRWTPCWSSRNLWYTCTASSIVPYFW